MAPVAVWILDFPSTAEGGCSGLWNQHNTQWQQEPWTSRQTMAIVGPEATMWPFDSSPVWTSSSWPQVANRPARQSTPHCRHLESSPLSCFNKAHMASTARRWVGPWLSFLLPEPRELWLALFLPAGAWRTGVAFFPVGQGLGGLWSASPYLSGCASGRVSVFPPAGA